jgi:predicted ester cyclase
MKTLGMTMVAAAAVLAMALSGTAQAKEASCSSKQKLKNEATVRVVFEDILSQGKIDENEHIYHRDFVVRGMTRDASRAEDRAASEGWRKMAPDIKMTVLRLVSDCDFVAAHWEGTGTNTGEGNGFPATGRQIRVRGMTLYRLVEGQIIEEWTSFDNYALLKQLGLIDNK